MFKFLRKIILILIIGFLVIGWVNLKREKETVNIQNIAQQSVGVFKPANNFLLEYIKSIFNPGAHKKIKSYELKSLKNKNNENEIKKKQLFAGTEDEIIVLINKERFDRGLKSLNKNEKLMKSALAKAVDMEKDRYFEHVSYRKIQPWFFAEKEDYQYEKFGENIALDYLSANSVHKAFMDSVGHRANIMDEDFKDVGVAIFPVETEKGLKYIVVEHFGRQLKKIDLEKREKYSNKSKRLCGIQKNKKKELKKMIKNQERVIEEFKNEINRKAVKEESQRLKSLENIKNNVDKYLDDCRALRKKFKK